MTRDRRGINDDDTNDFAFANRSNRHASRSSISVDASRALTRSHNCGLVFSVATHEDATREFLALDVTTANVNRGIPPSIHCRPEIIFLESFAMTTIRVYKSGVKEFN